MGAKRIIHQIKNLNKLSKKELIICVRELENQLLNIIITNQDRDLGIKTTVYKITSLIDLKNKKRI